MYECLSNMRGKGLGVMEGEWRGGGGGVMEGEWRRGGGGVMGGGVERGKEGVKSATCCECYHVRSASQQQ